MPYLAAQPRYESMPYRRCGRSGVRVPVISLGLWQNFGDDASLAESRAVLRRAFDLGICHLDLANNYGVPPGSAESTVGRILKEDFRPYRDELLISTKAGNTMWPGPYGELNSAKSLLASLDQSLSRLGLDYVDIFYSHRPDPDTPLAETMGALDTAVRSGKALYAGISSYPPDATAEAASLLNDLGTALLVHQPSYSMLDRGIESALLDVLEKQGVGCIAFSPLAQGLLTGKYEKGVPEGSRAARDPWLAGQLDARTSAHVRALSAMAKGRGQSLAQMALAWALRDDRVTSVLVGARGVEQLEENVAAIEGLGFADDELAAIDTYAAEAGLELGFRP